MEWDGMKCPQHALLPIYRISRASETKKRYPPCPVLGLPNTAKEAKLVDIT